MSKTIYEGKDFALTEFYGGVKEGISIQITKERTYIQLNKKEVNKLIKKLTKWLEKKDD